MNKTIGDQGKLISFANEVFADIKPLPDFADKVANNLLVNSISETPIKLIDSIGSQITTMNKTIEERAKQLYPNCDPADKLYSALIEDLRAAYIAGATENISSTSSNTQVTTICAKELRGEAGCKELCDECKGKRDRFAAVSTEAEGWRKQELISNEGWKVKLQFSPTVPKAVQDKFLEVIADYLLLTPPTVTK